MRNSQITNEFIKNLSEKTALKHPSIHWRSLLELKGISEKENSAAFYLVFTHEYREVIFSESFFTTWKQGFIYLVTEKLFSGYDGSISLNTILSVQESKSAPAIEIERNTDELEELKVIITSNYDTTVFPENFIQSFLEVQ